MKKNILLLLTVLTAVPCWAQEQGKVAEKLWQELDIVPMPKEIRLAGRNIPLDEKTVLVIGKEACRQSKIGADWINERIVERGGKPLVIISGDKIPAEKKAVIIGTASDNPLLAAAIKDGTLNLGEKNPGERGYEIKISSGDGKIYLGGADPLGALYSCVTFGELLQGRDQDVSWRAATVRDWPDQIRLFSLSSTLSTEDPAFPNLPKKITEESKKTYLDGVRKFHEWLLRRKLTGVNYLRRTLLGEKFVHAPWMDLMREGIEHGKERGIGALIYAEKPYPGRTKHYPEAAKERDKITSGLDNISKEWLTSWSFDEIRRETARNLAEYVRATGFTDVGFHDTDGGWLDNPAYWNCRGAADRKRWGDDYTAATIHIHKTYYDELKKLNPDLRVNFTFYPYCIYIFDDRAFGNIRKQTVGVSANMQADISAYQRKYGEFWRRLNAAFPVGDVTFCARETTWDSVVNWRKFIGNERGIFWWDAVGGKYWEPIFSQGPAWTEDFADNTGNIISIAYADIPTMPLNFLAVREYSWNRATPGATHFKPFDADLTDYWKWAEPEGDIYRLVLPNLVRNIFGAQAAPYILRAVSENIDILQALGRVRSSTYDLLKTPERRQWQADNAGRAADALNELWNKCRETGTHMGMDDRAFLSVIIMREALNGAKWYSKATAQLMYAEKFAGEDKQADAKQAIAKAAEYAAEGSATMKKLIAERPATFKQMKIPAPARKLMADNIDFASLSGEIAKLAPALAKIAVNGAKNKLILNKLAKGRQPFGLLVKNSAGIVVNGIPDEALWRQAPAIDCFTVLGQKKLAAAFTRAGIIRDAKNLYISWTCQAPPGETIQDKDTIDIFLRIPGVNQEKPMEFFISADGSVFSSISQKKALSFAVKREKDYWSGEMAMIEAELPKTGKTAGPWAINICRNCYSLNGPVQISSILPFNAAGKRILESFPVLRFSHEPADAPAVSLNVRDFKVQTVTLSDRVASVASFYIAIDSNVVLSKAKLYAETYGADGKLQRTRELAAFDDIYLQEEPKTRYEAEFTETVDRGGVLLRLKSAEGEFTRLIRFGGWEGQGADAALFAPGLDGGQALAGECFFTGSDKIFAAAQGTIEFFFKLKKNTVFNPAQYSCFVASGWIKKSTDTLGLLYLGILTYNGKLCFCINENGARSGTLVVPLPNKPDYQQWHHLACVLDSAAAADDQMRIYLDGKKLPGKTAIRTRKGVVPIINFYTASPKVVQLGALPGGYYPSAFLMDGFKISRVARYTHDFSVARKPPTVNNDTSALFHFDGSLQGGGHQTEPRAIAGNGGI